MNRILIAICLAMLSISAQANSISDWFAVRGMEVEACMGHTTFNRPDKGIYWQQGFPNTWSLKSPSYCIGVTGYATKSIRWRVGYMNLGQTSSSSIDTTDETYNGTDGCIPSGCGQMSNFITEGSVRGFTFSVAPEYKLSEKWKAFVEAGAFYYLPKTEVTAYRINRPDMPTGTYHYKAGWQVGPVLGFGIEHEKTQLVVTWYGVDAAGEHYAGLVPNWQPGITHTMNLSLRTRF